MAAQGRSSPGKGFVPIGRVPLYNISLHTFLHSLRTELASKTASNGSNFNDLRRKLTLLLPTAPSPGPVTFTIYCLKYITLDVTLESDWKLSHLLLTALKHSMIGHAVYDEATAKKTARRMILDAVYGRRDADPRLVARITSTFCIGMPDLMRSSTEYDEVKVEHSVTLYIRRLIGRSAFKSAVSMMKQLGLREDFSDEALDAMLADGMSSVAGEWASHIGSDRCHYLVKFCREKKLYKVAHGLVEKYGMEDSYPDSRFLYRKSSIEKLVSKGIWDEALSLADKDTELQEHLVIAAQTAGNHSRAELLSRHFNFPDTFLPSIASCQLTDPPGITYLKIFDLISGENLKWVDDTDGLEAALCHLAASDRVGIDAEWKPNRLQGQPANKVAVLQLSSSSQVFVIDVIRLAENHPDAVSKFAEAIFGSQSVLKLGYGLYGDLALLAKSYPDIGGFRKCGPLLDLQKLSPRGVGGGLSELSKKVLKAELDKCVRLTNWEERPLSLVQMEYAGLDALCLVKIYEAMLAEAEGYAAIREVDTALFQFTFWSSKGENFAKKYRWRKSKPAVSRKLSQNFASEGSDATADVAKILPHVQTHEKILSGCRVTKSTLDSSFPLYCSPNQRLKIFSRKLNISTLTCVEGSHRFGKLKMATPVFRGRRMWHSVVKLL